jgi:MSHA biogenesis protein MshL
MTLRRVSMMAPLLIMAACSHAPMKQSETHLTEGDGTQPPGSIPPPVQLSTILPKPRPTARPETYTVVVNNVKVQELLFALARDAKLNVDIYPGITGSVTLNAIEQTLPQLLSRIARQVDMRWELDGPNLLVMPDSPYLRVYRVDYVNMERTTQGTVGVSTQIATPGGSGGAGGGGNTSTTQVQNRSTNKFWETLVENIKDILRETDKIIPSSNPAAPTAVAPAASAPGMPGAPGTLVAVVAAPAAPSATFREAASVIANPEAGVLSIRATSRQHEKIQEFLDQVMASAKRQVMIEATIVEVQLNNQYQQGIDWALVRRGPSGVSVMQTPTGTTSPAGVNSSIFVGSLIDPNFRLGNLAVTIRLLESFGSVRVLSSPKISVINNQTALLKVVDNRVYFTIRADTTVTANVAATTTFTTTPNVVPVGFVMNVTPQISETDTVLLNLKPTISRIVGFVNDPNPALAAVNIVSRVPEVQTREMESMIKVNSGQMAVMGGLIQDSVSDVEDGIPGLNQMPLVGPIFTHRNKANAKTELVIFMRPIVVKDPSIDGDYSSFRNLMPDDRFLTRPNPGRATLREGAFGQ